MIPAKYDIKVFRGGRVNITFSAISGDVTINFNDYESTRLRVLPPYKHTHKLDSPKPLVEFECGNLIVSEAGDTLSFKMNAVETADLTFQEGRYFLDLIGANPVEDIDKFFYGKFTVTGEDDI